MISVHSLCGLFLLPEDPGKLWSQRRKNPGGQSICSAEGYRAECFLQCHSGILVFVIVPVPGQMLVLIMAQEDSVGVFWDKGLFRGKSTWGEQIGAKR